MESKIILLRHGITEGNKKRWYYGKTDLPLLPEGIETLQKLKEGGLYPELPDDALCFTTGLGRTAETFRVLFGDREFEKIKDLREINFGVCECKTYDELKDDPYFNAWAYDEEGDYELPEGESKNQFRERVARGFNYILERHNAHVLERGSAHGEGDNENAPENPATTVVICHGGVIAEILQSLFPEERTSIWDWMPEPGCGYVLDVIDGEIRKSCLLGEVIIY